MNSKYDLCSILQRYYVTSLYVVSPIISQFPLEYSQQTSCDSPVNRSGCFLWVQSIISILPFQLLCCIHHHASTHWGWDKMATISQTTFSNTFSWMKIYKFRFEFHWHLFLIIQLTISQLWFRSWFGAEQATSHYLNQCWPSFPTHICSTRGRWVKWPFNNRPKCMIWRKAILNFIGIIYVWSNCSMI